MKKVDILAGFGFEKVEEESLNLHRALQRSKIAYILPPNMESEYKENLAALKSSGLQIGVFSLSEQPGFNQSCDQILQALEGKDITLTPYLRAAYIRTNIYNTRFLEEDYDFVFVEGVQSLPLRAFSRMHKGQWIWHCPLDLSRASGAVLHFLKPYIEEYDTVITSQSDNIGKGLILRNLLPVPLSVSERKKVLLSYLARQVA